MPLRRFQLLGAADSVAVSFEYAERIRTLKQMRRKDRDKAARKRHVEWVKENLPVLAMLGEEKIEAVVARAQEAVGPLQYGLAFLTAMIPTMVGPLVVKTLFGDEPTQVENVGMLVALLVICAIVSVKVYEGILHRKIESLATRTWPGEPERQ